jgi:hypothetical protein
MPKSYLGAYWGPRQQSAADCADVLARVLVMLSETDDSLSGWRDKSASAKQALEAPVVTADHHGLVQRLSAARNRRDDDDQPIEELGFSVSWWNGAEKTASATLSLGCGAWSPGISNRLVLQLPDSRVRPDLYVPAVARSLVAGVVELLDPDWAVWTNAGLVDKQREPDQQLDNGGYVIGELVGHAAGWANYVSSHDSVALNIAALPESARVEPLASGTLVLLGEDPNDPALHDVLAVRRAMGYAVPADDLVLGAAADSAAAPVTAAQPDGDATPRPEQGDRPTGLTHP